MKAVERKVTRVENSLSVTFPQEVLKHLGIKQGDEVSFALEDESVTIKKTKELVLPKGIDSEFLEMMNDMVREYEDTFKGLADR